MIKNKVNKIMKIKMSRIMYIINTISLCHLEYLIISGFISPICALILGAAMALVLILLINEVYIGSVIRLICSTCVAIDLSSFLDILYYGYGDIVNWIIIFLLSVIFFIINGGVSCIIKDILWTRRITSCENSENSYKNTSSNYDYFNGYTDNSKFKQQEYYQNSTEEKFTDSDSSYNKMQDEFLKRFMELEPDLAYKERNKLMKVYHSDCQGIETDESRAINVAYDAYKKMKNIK